VAGWQLLDFLNHIDLYLDVIQTDGVLGGGSGGESGMINHAVPGGMFPSSSMKQNLQNSSEYGMSFFLGDGGDTLVLPPSN
jgi:hypothetical protein